MSSLIVASSITLNLSRPNSGTVLYAKQYDKAARVIDISLLSGSEVWDPPIDCEMIAMYAKPDGTKGIYDVVENYPEYSEDETYLVGDRIIKNAVIYRCTTAIDTPEVWNSQHWVAEGPVTRAIEKLDTGKVRLTLAEQALAVAGNVFFEISFYTSDLRSTTLSFIIAVETGIPDNGTIISSDYFNILSSMVQGLMGVAVNPPKINDDSTSEHYLEWQLWNATTNQYEDSGFSSVGTQGETGPRGHSISSVSLSSTGPAGQAGQTDTYSVYVEDTPQAVGTFVVYNGQDGQGAPATVTPEDLGEASIGSSARYAKEDHVHNNPSRLGFVTLNSDDWEQGVAPDDDVYSQEVSEIVDSNGNAITIGENDRIDLFAGSDIIKRLITDGVLAIYVDNGEGTVMAYSVGGVPSVDLEFPCTVNNVYVAEEEE